MTILLNFLTDTEINYLLESSENSYFFILDFLVS